MGYFRFYVAALFWIVGLSLATSAHAMMERDFDKNESGMVANLAIWLQKPLLYVYRNYVHSGLEYRQRQVGAREHTYLYREGKLPGLLVMVHGVLARKEFYVSLVSEMVKLQKPLPTLFIPDLLAHGSQPYPDDQKMYLSSFTRHLAEFIRSIRKEYPKQPLYLMGHSLGGGFVLLLKPLHGIKHDGLILISPAGLPNEEAQDFKARIEQAKGLPFDFGSSELVQNYGCCFEKTGMLWNTVFWLASGVYDWLDCPIETAMKNKMFRDLERSRKHLMSSISSHEVLQRNLKKPVHLIWTQNDRMFAPSRYEKLVGAMNETYTQLNCYREEGSHLWPYEHSDQAAARVLDILESLSTQPDQE